QEWNNTVVGTRRFVYLLKPDGSVVWKLPLEPISPDYREVSVYFLEPTNQFAALSGPSWAAKEQAKQPLPVHAVWLATAEGISKRADLPGLRSPDFTNPFEQSLSGLLMPPVLTPIALLSTNNSWHLVLVSMIAALLIYIPTSWWMGG